MTTGHMEVTLDAVGGEPTGPCAEDHCGIKEVLERLGDRWSLLILVELDKGPRRFRELQRAVPGISQRMLTVCTRNLVRDGLISRTVFATTPPQVEYALTDMGASLSGAINAVADWGRANHAAILQARSAFDAEQKPN